MLEIKVFEFNPFGENTILLFDETKACVVIDPGCHNKSERNKLSDFISTNKLEVQYLLNTHCHIDHVLGNAFVKDHYKVQLLIHPNDLETLRAVKVYAPVYGFAAYQSTEPDAYLNEGDVVNFGNQKLEVLFVPGHAPGHIAFYHRESKILIGGDVLFDSSIGRTDLPGGNFDVLIESINSKFFTLDDDVVVFPGHGPDTTIGKEKRTNPFCAITSK
jgi:hydroxyacylglutathione hydrolase